jgi:hypothetical protein
VTGAGARTLVVHSGTYKTGSSAIQRYLEQAEDAGVLGHATYPRIGRALGRQHLNLNAELREGPLFSPALGSWDDLLAAATGGQHTTTIVSTENFSLLSEDQIRSIGDMCRRAGIAVRWVHYLREQSSCYNAFYVERLVNMRPEFADVIDLPFEDFAEWSPLDLGFLTYSTFAETVLRAIPDVDLVLRPFARAEMVGGDVVPDFCATTGIPFVPEQSGRANVGTGWRTVETARRLTPVIAAADLPRRVADFENPAAAGMRWAALLRKELVLAGWPHGWNRDSAVYLRPEFEAVLRDRHRADNERVGRIAGFDWAAIADAEGSKSYNIGEYADIPGDQVAAVTAAVMTALVRMPEEIAALPRSAEPGAPGIAGRLARRLSR